MAEVYLEQAADILKKYAKSHRHRDFAEQMRVDRELDRITELLDSVCFKFVFKCKPIRRYNIDVTEERSVVGFSYRRHYMQCLIPNSKLKDEEAAERILTQFFTEGMASTDTHYERHHALK